MANLVICGPGCRDKANFHVHAAGCADLARNARRVPEYHPSARIALVEVATRLDVAKAIYDGDFDATHEELVNDFYFFPCCGELPLGAKRGA